jgi:hypothetical protein
VKAACSRRSRQAMLKFCQNDGCCRHANQDVAASQLRLMSTKPLPQHTLGVITVNRAPKDTLGNDETQPANAEGVGFEHHAETRPLERSRSGE